MAFDSTATTDATASASLTGATLVAKGAAVDVTFVYTCFPGGGAFDQLSASLTQKVSGGRVTTAGGIMADRPCAMAGSTPAWSG